VPTLLRSYISTISQGPSRAARQVLISQYSFASSRQFPDPSHVSLRTSPGDKIPLNLMGTECFPVPLGWGLGSRAFPSSCFLDARLRLPRLEASHPEAPVTPVHLCFWPRLVRGWGRRRWGQCWDKASILSVTLSWSHCGLSRRCSALVVLRQGRE
jgi:hypothetical protein